MTTHVSPPGRGAARDIQRRSDSIRCRRLQLIGALGELLVSDGEDEILPVSSTITQGAIRASDFIVPGARCVRQRATPATAASAAASTRLDRPRTRLPPLFCGERSLISAFVRRLQTSHSRRARRIGAVGLAPRLPGKARRPACCLAGCRRRRNCSSPTIPARPRLVPLVRNFNFGRDARGIGLPTWLFAPFTRSRV